MKTKFLIILFLTFSASAVFAQTRVMSNEERANLATDDLFKELCKQSATNYAVFIDEGVAGFPSGGGSTNRNAWIQYVKDLIFATDVVKKGGISDEEVGKKYLTLAKAKTFTLGAAPQSNATLIAAWQTANAFDEFNPGYFALLGNAFDTNSKAN